MKYIKNLLQNKYVKLISYLFVFALFLVALWQIGLANLKGVGWANWTGLSEFISSTGEYYRAKTLWDWLELLIVPTIIAFGIWLLNKNEKETEREIAQKRETIDRDIALTKQQQDTLEAYFDRMSELLLEKDLRNAKPENEVMIIARTRTLAVLRNLDGERKGQVIRFLREANLLSLINLDGANLSGANLSGIDLSAMSLKKADLSHADLRNTSFVSSDLQGAKLSFANLSGANLRFTVLITAILDNATLAKANFGEANISAANLRYADLRHASLIGANLSGANLSNANLSKAHLSLVKFGNANLSKANLSGAFIRESDLSKVKGMTIEQLSAVESFDKSSVPEGL